MYLPHSFLQWEASGTGVADVAGLASAQIDTAGDWGAAATTGEWGAE